MSALVGAVGAPLSPAAAAAPATGRACVGCGCTERNACTDDLDEPCSWELEIGEDGGICSSCIQIANRVMNVLSQLDVAVNVDEAGRYIGLDTDFMHPPEPAK